MRLTCLAPARKLLTTAVWAVASFVAATYLMAQANLAASTLLGPPRSNIVQHAQSVALVCCGTLAVALAAVVAAAALLPALRTSARRVAVCLACTFVTGVPASLVLVLLSTAAGKDLRGLAAPLGTLGFVLWMLALREGTRGVAAIWGPAPQAGRLGPWA